jgi:predicted MFS family arabinose efflux permease
MDKAGGLSEFRQGWTVVLAAAVGVSAGVNGVTFYTISVFLKPLAAEFHWSRAGVSAAILFQSMGWALIAPFVGRLADRIDVRKIALASLAGTTLGLLGLTQIDGHIGSLYLGLTILAVLGSGTAPLVWTLAVGSWFDRARGLSFGLTMAGSGIAAILAPRAVDMLIQSHGWQGGYVGLAAYTALIAFPVVFFLFRKKAGIGGAAAVTGPAPTGMTVGSAVRTSRFWRLMAGIFLIVGAVAAMFIHLVAFLTDSGLSRDDATGIAGLVGFAVVFSRVGVGFLLDRFHGPYVAGLLLTVPAIGYLLLASHFGGGIGMVAGALTFGVAAGAEVDMIAYLASRFFGLRAFGGIYGLLLVSFGVAAGIGPILMGRVYDVTGGYQPGLFAGALCCALSALLIGTLGQYPRHQATPETTSPTSPRTPFVEADVVLE